MTITEKMLLDRFTGKTNGGDNISIINGERILWNYRTGPTGDGYNCVCGRDRAGEISLEYDRVGTIDVSEDDHPGIRKIEMAEEKMWGTEV